MQKLAQPATLSMRSDVAVGSATASVIIAEGAAQIVWHAGGLAPLAGRSWFNEFITPTTGAELRALADTVDQACAITSCL